MNSNRKLQAHDVHHSWNLHFVDDIRISGNAARCVHFFIELGETLL